MNAGRSIVFNIAYIAGSLLISVLLAWTVFLACPVVRADCERSLRRIHQVYHALDHGGLG